MISASEYNVVQVNIVMDKTKSMEMIDARLDMLEIYFLVDRAPVPKAVFKCLRVLSEAKPSNPAGLYHAAKITGDVFMWISYQNLTDSRFLE